MEPWRVSAITAAARVLGAEKGPEFDAALHARDDVLHLPAARLRARAAQVAASIDPDGARERAELGMRDRNVRVQHGDDPGMSLWSAYQPTSASAAAWAAIDQLAHEYAAADPELTITAARADAMMDLLLQRVEVQTTVTLAVPTGQIEPPPESEFDTRPEFDLKAESESEAESGLESESDAQRQSESQSDAEPLFETEPDLEPVPATPDDDPATAAQDAPGDDSTTAPHEASTSSDDSTTPDPRPTTASAEPTTPSAEPDTTPAPSCAFPAPPGPFPAPPGPFPAPHGPFPAASGAFPPPVTLVNAGPAGWLLAETVAALLDHPSTRIRLAGIEPTWSAIHTLDQPAYRPKAALDRAIRERDRTCRFPGCATQAHRCDLDHVVPYPEGPTAASNLLTLCRRHHGFKHHARWTVTLSPEGEATWTSPTGLSHTTRPPSAADLVACAPRQAQPAGP